MYFIEREGRKNRYKVGSPLVIMITEKSCGKGFTNLLLHKPQHDKTESYKAILVGEEATANACNL